MTPIPPGAAVGAATLFSLLLAGGAVVEITSVDCFATAEVVASSDSAAYSDGSLTLGSPLVAADVLLSTWAPCFFWLGFEAVPPAAVLPLFSWYWNEFVIDDDVAA